MQKWIKVIFAVYILALIKLIIFKYPYEQLAAIVDSWTSEVVLEGLGSANFVPFKTIRMYIKYADRLNSFENLAGNIFAFVPFGLLLPFTDMRAGKFGYVIICALALIFGLELFQLVSAFGAFDVDDIILNCFGVLLGYVIYVKAKANFWHSGKTRNFF